MLNVQLGIKPTQVAYRGTGPALNDLVGGQVDFMCYQIVNLVEQIKSGAIKGYAIATPERSPALPDVPTTKEAGMPDYQVSAWNALFAPKGTLADILAKLTEALSKALDDEGSRKKLLDFGGVIPDNSGRTPAYLADFVKAELARWTPVLKAAGVVANESATRCGKSRSLSAAAFVGRLLHCCLLLRLPVLGRRARIRTGIGSAGIRSRPCVGRRHGDASGELISTPAGAGDGFTQSTRA